MFIDCALIIIFTGVTIWMIKKYKKIIQGYMWRILIFIEIIILSGFLSQLLIFIYDKMETKIVIRHWIFIEITVERTQFFITTILMHRALYFLKRVELQ